MLIEQTAAAPTPADATANANAATTSAEGATTPATETLIEGATTQTTTAPTAAEKTKLERAEAAAQKARAGARKNAHVMGELSRERAKSQQLEAERAQLAQKIQSAAELEAKLKADPYAVARERGLTAEQVAQRMLAEGTPEAKLEALERKYQAEREADRAELHALKQQINGEKRTVAVKQIETSFVKAAGNATKYPHLSKQPGNFVLNAAKNILREAAEDPRTKSHSYSDDEVLSFLESQYAKHATQNPKDASESSQGSGPSENSNPAPSRTITNKLASAKFSKISSFDELDDEEQKELMAEQLRQKFNRK